MSGFSGGGVTICYTITPAGGSARPDRQPFVVARFSLIDQAPPFRRADCFLARRCGSPGQDSSLRWPSVTQKN
jgi:hypothetical protein